MFLKLNVISLQDVLANTVRITTHFGFSLNSNHKLSYSRFGDKKCYGYFKSTAQKCQLRGFGFVSKKSVDRLPCS